MRVLVVKGWDRFQHYKDRDPPWIKLYRDLLTTESWVLGTDVSRLVQIAIMLLAARYQNATPHRWALLRKVASLDCSEVDFNASITHLANTGFLEIQGDAVDEKDFASAVLATCNTEAEQSRAETEQSRDRVRALRAPTATRLGEAFELTDSRKQIALAEGIDPAREFQNFRDYWLAASGAKARKHDWDATWRTWCRRAADYAKGPSAKKSFSTSDRSSWVPEELRNAAK